MAFGKLSLKARGFSLVEIILVIAITGILLAAAYPVGTNFLARSAYNNTINEVTSSLRIAQLNSTAGKEDSVWGVYLTSSDVTLFKGTNYASRDTTYDVVYAVPTTVALSVVPAEVIYDQLTGDPNSPLSLTIASSAGETTVVTVNEVGTVDVN